MQMGLRGTMIAGIAVLGIYGPPLWGQSTSYTAPRTADGRPDLNGVWQVLNTANYDIEAHPARPRVGTDPRTTEYRSPRIGPGDAGRASCAGRAGARRRGRCSRG